MGVKSQIIVETKPEPKLQFNSMEDLLLDSVSTTVMTTCGVAALPTTSSLKPEGKTDSNCSHHLAPTQEESVFNNNFSAELEASQHVKDDGRINLGDTIDDMFASQFTDMMEDECCIIEAVRA